MAKKSFYIKERYNPQTGVYYVSCGQLTVKEAKEIEKTGYGKNVMLRYYSESEYNAAKIKLGCIR